jgi:hypothetical protein
LRNEDVVFMGGFQLYEFIDIRAAPRHGARVAKGEAVVNRVLYGRGGGPGCQHAIMPVIACFGAGLGRRKARRRVEGGVKCEVGRARGEVSGKIEENCRTPRETGVRGKAAAN